VAEINIHTNEKWIHLRKGDILKFKTHTDTFYPGPADKHGNMYIIFYEGQTYFSKKKLKKIKSIYHWVCIYASNKIN